MTSLPPIRLRRHHTGDDRGAADQRVVEVVEDLLSFGDGLDLEQRPVAHHEVGRHTSEVTVAVLAVVRDGVVVHHDAPDAGVLRADDELIVVASPRTAP